MNASSRIAAQAIGNSQGNAHFTETLHIFPLLSCLNHVSFLLPSFVYYTQCTHLFVCLNKQKLHLVLENTAHHSLACNIYLLYGQMALFHSYIYRKIYKLNILLVSMYVIQLKPIKEEHLLNWKQLIQFDHKHA